VYLSWPPLAPLLKLWLVSGGLAYHGALATIFNPSPAERQALFPASPEPQRLVTLDWKVWFSISLGPSWSPLLLPPFQGQGWPWVMGYQELRGKREGRPRPGGSVGRRCGEPGAEQGKQVLPSGQSPWLGCQWYLVPLSETPLCYW
jgi:hypothetical protein